MIHKRLKSFQHALRGIAEFIKLGANAKIQALCALGIIISGFPLHFTPFEWIAVVLCIGCVLSAEAFNTAIEQLADEVSEDWKDRIRQVKDISAGAVLILALTSLAVAIIILSRRL